MSVELSTITDSTPTIRTASPATLLRIWRKLPTELLAATVLIVLLGGILSSALTTTDSDWWQFNFSQLGTFRDLSASLFNGGLQLGGLLAIFLALRVGRDIQLLGAHAGMRGSSIISFICLSTMGINLALVGSIPSNTDGDLHDKVAGSIVLGFLALLLAAPIMLHRLPRRLVLATAGVILWMAGAIWLFVSATVNLTLFEVLSFSAIFCWMGVFVSALRAHSQAKLVEQRDRSL